MSTQLAASVPSANHRRAGPGSAGILPACGRDARAPRPTSLHEGRNTRLLACGAEIWTRRSPDATVLRAPTLPHPNMRDHPETVGPYRILDTIGTGGMG